MLKPGGRFLCLEFSHVNNPLLSRWEHGDTSFMSQGSLYLYLARIRDGDTLRLSHCALVKPDVDSKA